jgi:hypothetical protein
MRRSLLSLLILALVVGPAWAEGAVKAKKKPPPGTTVEMPLLMAPMSQDGRLLGYAFITSKLVCASSDACIAVREKLAFIQDANVRDVNAQPIALASDPTAVDRDLLNVRMTANAKRIVGDNKVKNMVFLQVQYTSLHPSESTTGAPGSPDQAAAGGVAAGPSAAASPPNGAAVSVAGTATPAAATSKPPANPAH